MFFVFKRYSCKTVANFNQSPQYFAFDAIGMNFQTVLLLAIIPVQLYLVFDEVQLMWVDDDRTIHLHSVSTDMIGAISILLTAMCSVRLRHIQHSLSRVQRSLQIKVDNRGQQADVVAVGHWSIKYRTRGWLVPAVIMFGYLKYGWLMEHGEKTAQSGIVALLSTISLAGNYYVTLMFVDHVFFAKRSVTQVIQPVLDLA